MAGTRRRPRRGLLATTLVVTGLLTTFGLIRDLFGGVADPGGDHRRLSARHRHPVDQP